MLTTENTCKCEDSGLTSATQNPLPKILDVHYVLELETQFQLTRFTFSKICAQRSKMYIFEVYQKLVMFTLYLLAATQLVLKIVPIYFLY